LADFGQLPCWNPVVRRVNGQNGANGGGSVLREWLGRQIFRFVVLKSEPNRELRWRGWFVIPGLLHDECMFFIEPFDDEERVRIVVRQVFTGLLAPLCNGAAKANARKGVREIGRTLRCAVDERVCEAHP
jgi:hypothetical protein